MSASANGEKLSSELPRVRISEQMENDLMRAAAREDRSLSDLVRCALSQWLYGHVGKLTPPDEKA
jgi:hypothetical protein